MLNQVKGGKGAYGYNAGIPDPAKVTRLALQNAASVAGLLLTTEVMIAEAPKDEEHSHGRAPVEWAAWAGCTLRSGDARYCQTFSV